MVSAIRCPRWRRFPKGETSRTLLALIAALAVLSLSSGSGKAADRRQCLIAIAPMIAELNVQIKALREALSQTSVRGPRAPHGACTMRLARIAGTFCASYQRTAQEADLCDRMSCLELRVIYARRICDCTARSLHFDSSDDVVDRSLLALRRLQKAQAVIRKLAIRNTAIRQLVNEATRVRDCYSEQTVQILNATATALEKIAATGE